MSYATRADLEKRYGAEQLEQRELMLEAGAVAGFLADADALIDGYLAGRYTVPLSPVPANLPQLACAVARYYLLGDSKTEFSRQEFEDALSWLKAVAAGSIPLPAVATAVTPATGGTPVTRTTVKQFSGANLASY